MIFDFLYSMMMLIMFLEGVYKFVFVKYRCNQVYNKLISFIVYLQILVK